jgi:hypothetical protein
MLFCSPECIKKETTYMSYGFYPVFKDVKEEAFKCLSINTY